MKIISAAAFTAFVILLFSINGMAQTNSSDIQVILKTKNLGLDPINPGNGNIGLINITVNKIGNLTYIENYYSVDSFNVPKFYTANRHDVVMNDYDISFTIDRPHSKHGQLYSLIESVVVLDNERVYDVWINFNGTGKYRSFNGTMHWINSSNGNNGNFSTQVKRELTLSNNNLGNLSKENSTDLIVENTTSTATSTTTKKSPMPEIISILFILIISYRYAKR